MSLLFGLSGVFLCCVPWPRLFGARREIFLARIELWNAVAPLLFERYRYDDFESLPEKAALRSTRHAEIDRAGPFLHAPGARDGTKRGAHRQTGVFHLLPASLPLFVEQLNGRRPSGSYSEQRRCPNSSADVAVCRTGMAAPPPAHVSRPNNERRFLASSHSYTSRSLKSKKKRNHKRLTQLTWRETLAASVSLHAPAFPFIDDRSETNVLFPSTKNQNSDSFSIIVLEMYWNWIGVKIKKTRRGR